MHVIFFYFMGTFPFWSLALLPAPKVIGNGLSVNIVCIKANRIFSFRDIAPIS